MRKIGMALAVYSGLALASSFSQIALSQTAPAQTAPAQTAPAPAAAADTRINLRLFAREEVDRSRGCSLALWQADRDPGNDRFAHVFLEDIGRNDVRQPARLKIGEQVLQFQRVAIGGKKFGYNTFEYQVYRSAADGTQIILDLKLEDSPGEVMDVNSGTLTIVQTGKLPFVAKVKGGAGCMTPAAAAPPPAAPARPPVQAQQQPLPRPAAPSAQTPAPGMFQKYAVRNNLVPAVIRNTAKKRFECNDEIMKRPVIGFHMSEESAIWEIQCDNYAYQGSSIFVLVYLSDPAAQHEFLTFSPPPGKQRSTEPNLLMSPEWDVRTRTVTGISFGRAGGDCGSLERHRVNQEGKFVLLEYREKVNCDGKETPAQNYPLVYRAR